MKSIFRFLIFLAVAASLVSALYFWRAFSLATKPEVSPGPPSSDAPPPVVSGALAALPALDREFQQLVDSVRPSVVSITAENQLKIRNGAYPGWGTLRLPPNLGSGVIVSADGHVVTNLHVIRDANSILVHLNDGRVLPARILGADPLTDIAILKIEAEDLRPLPFGDSDLVRPGQIVLAIGNPYGLQETVTQGIVSGIGRRSESEAVNEFFQTDTAINPGNSGGPLLNIRGEIIGINNFIHTQSGGWQGISFSIPSNTARRVFDDIVRHGRVIRSWFGVGWDTHITPALASRLRLPSTNGVLIRSVYDASPAARAGIQPGDVIVEFSGKPIRDGFDLRNRVAETEAGQVATVRVIRNGSPVELKVELQEFPGS